MSVSIVVPLCNERENVARLWEQLSGTLRPLGRPYELLFVDDGSTDGTVAELELLAQRDPDHVRLLVFRRNYGQTAAMHAGIQAASGEVIVTMDGDLQNDPRDIRMLLEKIDEGYDLVHGCAENVRTGSGIGGCRR